MGAPEADASGDVGGGSADAPEVSSTSPSPSVASAAPLSAVGASSAPWVKWTLRLAASTVPGSTRVTWGGLVWTQAHLRSLGAALGAGALVSLAPGDCPVALTAAWTEYLAGESARRCGRCRNGLPALAQEVGGLAEGADTRRRIQELTGLVVGRGACAHPDGTARLVHSLLTTLHDHVEDHLAGAGGCGRPFPARVA